MQPLALYPWVNGNIFFTLTPQKLGSFLMPHVQARETSSSGFPWATAGHPTLQAVCDSSVLAPVAAGKARPCLAGMHIAWHHVQH